MAADGTAWTSPDKQKAPKAGFLRKKFYFKKSRYADSQLMEALKRVKSGLPVPELRRAMGISTTIVAESHAKSGEAISVT